MKCYDLHLEYFNKPKFGLFYDPLGLFVEWYNTGLHAYAGLQYNGIDCSASGG